LLGNAAGAVGRIVDADQVHLAMIDDHVAEVRAAVEIVEVESFA
jgi:hypothetical protein